jgi:coenzyme F420 hydrogenase subunit beta
MSNKKNVTDLTHPIDEERLSFKRLHQGVIEKGICSMCYGCVCFCSANEMNVLTIKDDKPTYEHETDCLKCGICYLICPRTNDLDAALKTKFRFNQPIGHFESIRCLRTTDEEISAVCCDGGVVTSILRFLLDNKRIDGAIVSKREDLWNNKPMIATKFEDLLECAGSSLSHSASISDMGNLTTYASILGVIEGSKRLDLTKLAVVGTPCQIKTIRKMQMLHIIPSHLVYYTIGLFCFENFLLHEEGKRYLEKKMGANLNQIKKINLKENFIITLNDGRTLHIDLEDLGPIIRPECLACTDFSNYTADLSLGGLGSPEGYTSTLIRSKSGQTIINEAISQGYLKEIELDHQKMAKTIEKMALRKRNRGKKYLT